jgi:hypothetical protein
LCVGVLLDHTAIVLTDACQPATSVDHLTHSLVNVSRLRPADDDQGPDCMLRLDNHIDDDIGRSRPSESIWMVGSDHEFLATVDGLSVLTELGNMVR